MSVGGIGGGSNVGGVGPIGNSGSDSQVSAMTEDLWSIASLISEGSFGDVQKYVDDLCTQWNARTDSDSWGNTEAEAKIKQACQAICSLDNPKCLGIINFIPPKDGSNHWHLEAAQPKGQGATGTTWWDPGDTPRRGDPDANFYIVSEINHILDPSNY